MAAPTEVPTLVPVSQIEPGDHIVNVGTVIAVNSVSQTSVFMALLVSTERWSLANGRPVEGREDLIVHEGTDLFVMRPNAETPTA